MAKQQKLTERQKRTAYEYVYGVNKGRMEPSMLVAGFSPNYARAYCGKMLANVGVQGLIEQHKAELQAKDEWTRLQSRADLSSIAAAAREKGDLPTAIQANKELNKLYGLITDRHEIIANTGHRPADAQAAIQRSRQRVQQVAEDTNGGLVIADSAVIDIAAVTDSTEQHDNKP